MAAFTAMAEQADDALTVLTHILDPAHFAEMHARGRAVRPRLRGEGE